MESFLLILLIGVPLAIAADMVRHGITLYRITKDEKE